MGRNRFGVRIMLLAVVELYMQARRMSPTRFGMEAMGDPQFVFQLRLGRRPRAATEKRVFAYISGKG